MMIPSSTNMLTTMLNRQAIAAAGETAGTDSDFKDRVEDAARAGVRGAVDALLGSDENMRQLPAPPPPEKAGIPGWLKIGGAILGGLLVAGVAKKALTK